MDGPMALSLVETLDTPGDPRVDRTKLHNLTDILVLSVLAVICGADSFVAIALFGQLNEEWLRTFMALPHGIPSHDTLGRVFARLDAARFEEGFRDWVQDAFALTEGQVLPIDGKRVRGSHDWGRGLAPARSLRCLKRRRSGPLFSKRCTGPSAMDTSNRAFDTLLPATTMFRPSCDPCRYRCPPHWWMRAWCPCIGSELHRW